MQPTPTSLVRAAACVLTAFFLFAGFRPAAAAVLATNDTCADATLIPANGPFPYLTAVVDVSNATTNDDPVVPELIGDCATVTVEALSHSVWYKFTPSSTARYSLSLGPDTLTTLRDTVMALYTTPSGCAGLFSAYDCNDASGSESRSGIFTNLTAGTTYYLVVWGAFTDGETNLDVQLRVAKPVVPANDTCAGALTIPASGPFPYQTALIDTTLATVTDDPTNTGCAMGFRSVWYKFSPSASGIYVFSTGTETGTLLESTAMTLYRNNGNCSSPFTEIISCSDNTNGIGRAIVSSNLIAGSAYYLVVWDNSDLIIGETALQIRVLQATGPTVTTLAATNIASSNATLRALVNPNGLQSRFWFEWGATTNYTSTNLSKLLNVGTSEIFTNVTIAGLMPTTNYHFRVVATNSAGKSYGIDQTFRWSNSQPIITSPVSLPGGEFKFQFTGSASQSYAVQGSTNLVMWVDLGAATELGGGNFQFIHAATAGVPYRFYKVRLP